MSRLVCITPTGDRPEAFMLCQLYMERQTLKPDMWLVIDDGTALLEDDDFLSYVGTPIHHIPSGPHPGISLPQNLKEALALVEPDDRLVMMEDDDWYAADYVEWMAGLLDVADLVGEGRSRYYHVPTRRWRHLGNRSHASLCSTGMKGAAMRELQQIVKQSNDPFVDMRLWQRFGGSKALRWVDDTMGPQKVIGIKGMPGRAGAGSGHRPWAAGHPPSAWSFDANLSVLRKWIGDDVQVYEDRYQPELWEEKMRAKS